jgi:hypothetical protein
MTSASFAVDVWSSPSLLISTPWFLEPPHLSQPIGKGLELHRNVNH